MKTGSFGGELEALVAHFPARQDEANGARVHRRSRALQEKLDVHSLLFERAWQLNRSGGDENGR
ncbi:MAG TPA: hypothetical protein VF067_00745 [Sphingomicrobium sp.]